MTQFVSSKPQNQLHRYLVITVVVCLTVSTFKILMMDEGYLESSSHLLMRKLQTSSRQSQQQPVMTTTIPPVKNPYHLNYVLTDKPYSVGLCRDQARPVPSIGPLKHLYDFTPTVTSINVNVLFMGDSVGNQFYEWFTDIIHKSSPTLFTNSGEQILVNRKRVLGSYRFGNGGGVVSFIRNMGMLNQRNDNPNLDRKGHLDENHAKILMDQFGHYDVLVYRTSWPHMSYLTGHIQESDYLEVLKSAFAYFRVKTVILVTSPYNNNAYNKVDILRKDNNVIRKFVKDYVPPADGSGVQHVILLDYEHWTNLILMMNGSNMGISPEDIFKTSISKQPYNLHAAQAMICAGDSISPETSEVCLQGYSSYSYDGMHWCPEMSVRTTSALYCLISCLYNHNDYHKTFPVPKSDQERCQKDCNRQFMSLNEIRFTDI